MKQFYPRRPARPSSPPPRPRETFVPNVVGRPVDAPTLKAALHPYREMPETKREMDRLDVEGRA